MLQEKINLLKVLGADVRPVPAVPFDNPANYNHQVFGNTCIQVHYHNIELAGEMLTNLTNKFIKFYHSKAAIYMQG